MGELAVFEWGYAGMNEKRDEVMLHVIDLFWRYVESVERLVCFRADEEAMTTQEVLEYREASDEYDKRAEIAKSTIGVVALQMRMFDEMEHSEDAQKNAEARSELINRHVVLAEKIRKLSSRYDTLDREEMIEHDEVESEYMKVREVLLGMGIGVE